MLDIIGACEEKGWEKRRSEKDVKSEREGKIQKVCLQKKKKQAQ